MSRSRASDSPGQAVYAGQGVVEYAGAIVIAVAVVALIISLDPEESATAMYDGIINTYSTFIGGEVSSLGDG